MPLYVSQSHRIEQGRFRLWGDVPELSGDRIVIPEIFEGRWNDMGDCLLLYGLIKYYELVTLSQAELALVLSPADYREYAKNSR